MLGRKPTDFVTVKDVPAHDFIVAYADHLKKSNIIEVPEDAIYFKTAIGKELAPYNPDWWYIRAASIVRKIYLRPGIGVGRMRHMYGGRNNKGVAREHHYKGAGKHIRNILQSLQEADIVMRLNDQRNKSYGTYLPEGDEELFTRVVTPEGQRSLNEVAKSVFSTLIHGGEEQPKAEATA